MALKIAAKNPLFPLNLRLLSQKLKFWESLLISALFAGLVVMAAVSCSGSPRPRFTYHIVDERKPYGGVFSGQDAAMEVSFKLLDVSDEENRALRGLLKALCYGGRTPAAYAEKTASEYRERYRAIENTYRDDPNPPLSGITIRYDESFDISLSGSLLLVISRNWDYYTGGAHGMQEREWFVIDKSVPERVLPADVFKTGTEEHLRAAVIGALQERGFLVDGRVDLLNFVVTDNFYFTREGIGFSWDPYEIAAYSEGIVSVVVPYAKIKNILSRRGQELARDAQKTP
jgi:hypothetical protein